MGKRGVARQRDANEVAIYETQAREDDRAGAEGRKPRVIATMADVERYRAEQYARALARFGANDSFETNIPPSTDDDMMAACDFGGLVEGQVVHRSYGRRWVWKLTDKGRAAMGGNKS